MRLWTIHPKHLDAKGLTALWREALLAQKVLQGKTRGYKHHPQLKRFFATGAPVAAVASYLSVVHQEAARRGYRFDRTKISRRRFQGTIEETNGQLFYEWRHLKNKLQARAPESFRACETVTTPEPHPLFRIVDGPVKEWEKVTSTRRRVASEDRVFSRAIKEGEKTELIKRERVFRRSLAEDAEDLATFEERADEPDLLFEDVVI